jgi:hypothetical protein
VWEPDPAGETRGHLMLARADIGEKPIQIVDAPLGG